MRFLLDLQVLQAESRTRGIGRYSRGLAQSLLTGEHGTEASVLLNLAFANELLECPQSRDNRNKAADYWREYQQVADWIVQCRPGIRVNQFRGLTGIAGIVGDWTRIRAAEILYDGYVRSLGADLIHVPSPFEGFGDDAAVAWTDLSCSGPVRAVTLYDLIPFERPELHLIDPLRERWFKHRLAGLTRADLILTISEHTRKIALDILDIPGDRVVNIGADTEPIFRRRELTEEQKIALFKKYGLERPFVVHVGILEERKNVATLVRALAQLSPATRAAHQLLLVAEATSNQMEGLRAVARQAGLAEDSLVFAGFVPDYDLVQLYSTAAAVVMPSLNEGFGLPILEGMRCGAPILASNAASLPEVVGTPRLLFDPNDSGTLAAQLEAILTDTGFRQFAIEHGAVQEKKFSWPAIAARAYEAFAEAAAREKRDRGPPRKRTEYVLVPPLQPSLEAIQRTERLAATLQNVGEVTVVGDPTLGFALKGHRFSGTERLNKTQSFRQRILLVSNSSTLDIQQQSVLAAFPVFLAPVQSCALDTPQREWLYFLRGYSGISSQSYGSTNAFVPALQAAYPQLVGIIDSESSTLLDELESLYNSHSASSIVPILGELKALPPALRQEAALAIADNHAPSPQCRRLLVDITRFVRVDPRSGIQRVVRKTLEQLLGNDFGVRVEPIYRDRDVYRYARAFTCALLNVSPLKLKDGIVSFHPSDTFLGLDLDIEISKGAADRLRDLRGRGGSVNIVVYDLLPFHRPQSFPKGTVTAFHNWLDRVQGAATRLIAISQSVADDLAAALQDGKSRVDDPLQLSWFHLGTDFHRSRLADPFLSNDNAGLSPKLLYLCGKLVFLVVGTIEPRKGISQLLDAAEEIWRDCDVQFVLAGKNGWHVDDLIARIQHHPQLNNRLFWFDDLSDELLAGLYNLATAVIVCSEAEGFGLPLIEARAMNRPIIARDIPVFREVAGPGAFYFTADDGQQLAAALRQWLKTHPVRELLKPGATELLDWQQSTAQLVDACLGRRPYRTINNISTAQPRETASCVKNVR